MNEIEYSHKHHVIPRHEWKARFGNLKGFNTPENSVYLTTEQHAHAHLLLWELNHNPYDLIAYRGLSRQIGKEEATRQAVILANTGKSPWNKGLKALPPTPEQRTKFLAVVRSPEHRKKLSLSHIGIIPTPETRKKMSDALRGEKSPNYGKPMSLEIKKKISATKTGKPISPEHKEKIRQGMKRHFNHQKELL